LVYPAIRLYYSVKSFTSFNFFIFSLMSTCLIYHHTWPCVNKIWHVTSSFALFIFFYTLQIINPIFYTLLIIKDTSLNGVQFVQFHMSPHLLFLSFSIPYKLLILFFFYTLLIIKDTSLIGVQFVQFYISYLTSTVYNSHNFIYRTPPCVYD
jgi:hypothetical protein